MKYIQTLFDDEYESGNIASQKELRSISGNINLNHLAIPLSVTKYSYRGPHYH